MLNVEESKEKTLEEKMSEENMGSEKVSPGNRLKANMRNIGIQIKALRSNKKGLVLLIIVFLFVLQAVGQDKIAPLKYIDELTALAGAGAMAFEFYKRLRARGSFKNGLREETASWPKSLWVFLAAYALFLGMGWLSTLVNHYQPLTNVLKDCFANMKFFLTFGGAYCFFSCSAKREADETAPGTFVQESAAESAEKAAMAADKRIPFSQGSPLEDPNVCKLLFLLIRVSTYILLVLTVFDEVFHCFPGDYRWGLVWCTPLSFESYAGLVAYGVFVIAMLLRLYRNLGNKVLPPLGAMMFVVLCTWRVKGILAIALAAVLYYLFLGEHEKKLWSRIVIYACAGASCLVGLIQFFYYYWNVSVGLSQAPRRVLSLGGPYLAGLHWPFGCGWATYGSAFSIEPYSQVYVESGINQVWGLSEKDHQYISDTFWPMIMGETGYIGLAAFAVVLLIFTWWIWQKRKADKTIIIPILFLYLYLWMMTLGESAFVHPAAVPFAFWIGLLFAECGGRKC